MELFTPRLLPIHDILAQLLSVQVSHRPCPSCKCKSSKARKSKRRDEALHYHNTYSLIILLPELTPHDNYETSCPDNRGLLRQEDRPHNYGKTASTYHTGNDIEI